MILYKEGNLTHFEIRSDHLNSDWTGKADFILDDKDPDNQKLFDKIFQYAPYMDYVLDDNGNLIDVIKTQDKPVYVPEPSRMDILEEENKILQEEVKTLKAKNQAITESNQFLEDCIVELAETVYA
jgi:hypothetical protein